MPETAIIIGGDDFAAAAADVCYLPEPDPLGLEPHVSTVPPAWIDPMLEELAASQVMHRAADAPTRVAPMAEVYDGAVIATSTVIPGTTDPLPLLPVHGTPPSAGPPAGEVASGEVGVFEPAMHTAGTSTPTRDGHPIVQITPDLSTSTKDAQPDSHATSGPSDATPTPGEAARRLARFVDEVQVKRRSPLLATPPQQKAATVRPLPVRGRSRRIAAQPLAHIPTSKRGEALLRQRLGVVPPVAPASPASKVTFDAIRTGNLTSSQVDALDALFPAFNECARELFVEAP
jgi:hypothetical protein